MPKIDDNNNAALLNEGEEPKVRVLMDALDRAIANASYWIARTLIAKATMWTLWENQSPDGLKHQAEGDKKAVVPWDGCSDTRVRLAAEKVREACAMQALAIDRANMQIIGREGADHVSSKRATHLFKWMLEDKMRNAQGDLDVGRVYKNSYGVNIMGVEWIRQTRAVLEDVPLSAFAATLGVQLPQEATLPAIISQLNALPPELYEQAMQLIDMFTNANREQEILDMVSAQYPVAGERRLSQALESWRSGEVAKLPVERVISEAPKLTPLLPFDDVFFPVSTEDLQNAPWIAVREWMTEQDIRTIARAEDWDEDFVEKIIETKGASSTQDTIAALDQKKFDLPFNPSKIQAMEEDDKIEIFYVYYRAVDDDGVESIYRLVASNALFRRKDENGTRITEENILYGKNEVFDSVNGEYPFFDQYYWRTDKTILDNVGIPWLVGFTQQNVKRQRDMRFNLSEISTIPPIVQSAYDSFQAPILGPAAVLHERTPQSVRFLNPPNGRVDLPIELENTERRDAGRMTGSVENGVPGDLIIAIQSYDTTNYVKEIREVFKCCWKMCQQYLGVVTVIRVTGSMKPFAISPDDIRGDYDLSLKSDPNFQNQEMMKLVIDGIAKIKGFDSNGIVDNNFIVRYLLGILSPYLADMAITDESQGQQSIVLEEKQNITLMMTGQSAPLKQQESAPQLRVQTIMQELQSNPVVGAAYQGNERIKQAFDQRIQNLQMQIMQQQNAVIGALGVDPNLNAGA